MKNKTLKLAAVSFLAVIALAGCSSDKNVATMKGGKITENDLYTELKKSQTTSDTLTSMILNKVVDNAYGDKVDKKELDKSYDEAQEQYGGKKAFEDILKQNNMDTKTFKESIKTQLAFEAMLDAHIKVTEDDLKAAWETYHPSVDAQIIAFATEDEATAALKEINDGKSFDEVAKEKSTDTVTKEDGGKVTFDSVSSIKPETAVVPELVKAAAYDLEDGKVSEVITELDPNTGAESFYIVKMVKNQKKGNDYKKFEKELNEVAETTLKSDPAFQQEVIGEELDKAKVKIDDKDFASILDAYLPQKEEETKSTDSTEAVVEEEATDATE